MYALLSCLQRYATCLCAASCVRVLCNCVHNAAVRLSQRAVLWCASNGFQPHLHELPRRRCPGGGERVGMEPLPARQPFDRGRKRAALRRVAVTPGVLCVRWLAARARPDT